MLKQRTLLTTLGLLLLLGMAPAIARKFDVEGVTTGEHAGMLTLDARVDLGFSDLALEALANGVPLTVNVHIQLRRAKAWVWEGNLVDEQLRYAVRYKPLSERYFVWRLPSSQGKSYVTREAAIAALGELPTLELLHLDQIDPGKDYVIRLQAYLDIEQLPVPLRPIAYLHPGWKHSSGWTSWPLRY